MENRIYKFRAKNLLTLKWEYYSLQDLIDGGAKGVVLDYWSEWTGLKDKNGKEIFEGDIIKTDEFGGKISEVYFSEQGFWLFGNPKNKQGEVFMNENHYEIIGNIFENKNLLKQERYEKKKTKSFRKCYGE